MLNQCEIFLHSILTYTLPALPPYAFRMNFENGQISAQPNFIDSKYCTLL